MSRITSRIQPPTLGYVLLLTMYKGPVGQYANYIDEGMERANDSQSVKCSYSLQAGADPSVSPHPTDNSQAKGHLSWGQRASPLRWSERRCYGNGTG